MNFAGEDFAVVSKVDGFAQADVLERLAREIHRQIRHAQIRSDLQGLRHM